MNCSFDPIYFDHFDKTHNVLLISETFIFSHKHNFVDQSERRQRKFWHSTNLSTNRKKALQTLFHSWILDWFKKFYHTGFPANWRTYERTFVFIEKVFGHREYILQITGVEPRSQKILKVIKNRSVVSLLLNIRNMIYCISPWHSGTENIIFYLTFCFRKMQHLAWGTSICM